MLQTVTILISIQPYQLAAVRHIVPGCTDYITALVFLCRQIIDCEEFLVGAVNIEVIGAAVGGDGISAAGLHCQCIRIGSLRNGNTHIVALGTQLLTVQRHSEYILTVVHINRAQDHLVAAGNLGQLRQSVSAVVDVVRLVAFHHLPAGQLVIRGAGQCNGVVAHLHLLQLGYGYIGILQQCALVNIGSVLILNRQLYLILGRRSIRSQISGYQNAVRGCVLILHTQSVGGAVVQHILLLAAGRYGPLVNGADYALRYSKGTYGAVEIRLILKHVNGRGVVYHILKCNRELTAQRFRIVGIVQRSNQSAGGAVQYLLAGLLGIGSGLADVAVATAVVLYIRPVIIRTVRIVSTGSGLRALVFLCLKHIFHLTVRIAGLRQIFVRKGVLILGAQYHHECVIRGVIRRDFNALDGCVQSVFLVVDVCLIFGQLGGGALYSHRALQQGFH